MNNRLRIKILSELVKANENMKADLMAKNNLSERSEGYLTGKIEAYKNVMDLLPQGATVKVKRIRIAVVEEPRLYKDEGEVMDILLDLMEQDEE